MQSLHGDERCAWRRRRGSQVCVPCGGCGPRRDRGGSRAGRGLGRLTRRKPASLATVIVQRTLHEEAVPPARGILSPNLDEVALVEVEVVGLLASVRVDCLDKEERHLVVFVWLLHISITFCLICAAVAIRSVAVLLLVGVVSCSRIAHVPSRGGHSCSSGENHCAASSSARAGRYATSNT